jgi:hypothetical protein
MHRTCVAMQGTGSYACTICGKVCKNLRGLKTHERSCTADLQHRDVQVGPSKIGGFHASSHVPDPQPSDESHEGVLVAQEPDASAPASDPVSWQWPAHVFVEATRAAVLQMAADQNEKEAVQIACPYTHELLSHLSNYLPGSG